MSSWGNREHRWEGRTSFLLVVDTIIAGCYLLTSSSILAYVLSGLVVLTLVFHTVARFSHVLEKRYFRKNKIGRY